MKKVTRREFIAGASAMGATLAWGQPRTWRSRERWTERRDEWLAGDDGDFKDLPDELESLSL